MSVLSLHYSLGEAISSQTHIYFEAEDAERYTPHFEIAQALEASNAKCLWAPDTFDGSHDGQGEAVYTFDIARPGSYRLVARVLGEVSYARYINFSIADKQSRLDTGNPNAPWEWRTADGQFELPAGKHSLVAHNKDDGVKLDCIVLYRIK